jgi:hypothetical protein
MFEFLKSIFWYKPTPYSLVDKTRKNLKKFNGKIVLEAGSKRPHIVFPNRTARRDYFEAQRADFLKIK